MLRPIARPPSRAAGIADRLAEEIASGRLAPGARLPTEAAMMAGFEVSRTVVREAIAALKARGLVVTHQGLGGFVADGAAREPFRIETAALGALDGLVEVMELRLAVEMEAAGLAAERATARTHRALAAALAAIDRATDRGEAAIEEDMRFHAAIAAAAHNAQFERFLDYLGRFVVPRQAIRLESGPSGDRMLYMRTFQQEHRAIVAAIRAGDAAAARAAMREHLSRGQERYRSMMARRSAAAG